MVGKLTINKANQELLGTVNCDIAYLIKQAIASETPKTLAIV